MPSAVNYNFDKSGARISKLSHNTIPEYTRHNNDKTHNTTFATSNYLTN